MIRKYIRKINTTILLFFMSIIAKAQDTETVEMANVMRSNGKIYIVVAVLVTILISLFVYLISIDRKISKIEKHIK